MSDKPRPNEPATSGLGSTEKWQGWAELENDPAIFSTLLREWGVPNVRIQEVFELDLLFNEETDPILGLVLLSRWISPEDASDHQLTTAPAALWFANQVRPLFEARQYIPDISHRYPLTHAPLLRS